MPPQLLHSSNVAVKLLVRIGKGLQHVMLEMIMSVISVLVLILYLLSSQTPVLVLIFDT
jgi:hypothetical protein